MIGKSLSERHGRGRLADAKAIAQVGEALTTQAANVLEIRLRDPRMVACLVVQADRASVRRCEALGFSVSPGGTGVFGLLGADAARLFPELGPAQRAWLEISCTPRETKVLLISSGFALLSLETNAGKVTITAAP